MCQYCDWMYISFLIIKIGFISISGERQRHFIMDKRLYSIYTVSTVIIFLYFLVFTHGLLRESARSSQIQSCYDSFAISRDSKETVGAVIHWKCVQLHTWKLLKHRSLNITPADRDWIESITAMPIMAAGRRKRQAPGGLRMRREYRMMTLAQRNDYHRAVNMLKDGRVRFLYTMDTVFEFGYECVFRRFKIDLAIHKFS